MAWQEIANIVNAGMSVKRDIKVIQKKWDKICATAKTEVSLHLIQKKIIIVEPPKTEQ